MADEMKISEKYDFEIPRVIDFSSEVVRKNGKNTGLISIQLPEGLVCYSTVIADLLEKKVSEKTNKKCNVVVFGDVVYGACNFDDCAAKQLGADAFIHFGHSGIVGIAKEFALPTLFIQVKTRFDINKCSQELYNNLKQIYILPSDNNNSKIKERIIFLTTTAQFCDYIPNLILGIEKLNELDYIKFKFDCPTIKPLHTAEILGCTCPSFTTSNSDCGSICNSQVSPSNLSPSEITIISVVDGLFHVEAAMIANPGVKEVYRFNPYTYVFDKPDTQKICNLIEYRWDTVQKASEKMIEKRDLFTLGIVFGTLGRQGSLKTLERLLNLAKIAGIKTFLVTSEEVFPPVMLRWQEKTVDLWVQLSCPRLSFDWGSEFGLPLLNAFEAFNLLNWYQDTKKGKNIGINSSFMDWKLKNNLEYRVDNFARSFTKENSSCDHNNNIEELSVNPKSSNNQKSFQPWRYGAFDDEF